jgi:hypothetical protein
MMIFLRLIIANLRCQTNHVVNCFLNTHHQLPQEYRTIFPLVVSTLENAFVNWDHHPIFRLEMAK